MAVIEDMMMEVSDNGCDFAVSNISVEIYVSFSRHSDYKYSPSKCLVHVAVFM